MIEIDLSQINRKEMACIIENGFQFHPNEQTIDIVIIETTHDLKKLLSLIEHRYDVDLNMNQQLEFTKI